MSALAHPCEFVSAEEYLERERAAETKSEYFNGTIVTRESVTADHDTIALNVTRLIGNQVVDRPCRVFSSDMKVRIERANVFRYPDASALCGPVAFHDRVRDGYLNPSFICEVLSPGTAAYDLGDKFALYRLIDSFVEYLVIDQERLSARLFRRSRNGGWESSDFTDPGETITLESIGCTLSMADLYAKVDFGS